MLCYLGSVRRVSDSEISSFLQASFATGMHDIQVALILFLNVNSFFFFFSQTDTTFLYSALVFLFLLLKWSLDYQLLLFSFYEDLAVTYLFLFLWWGV